jgi:cytoskeletal protein RodZ
MKRKGERAMENLERYVVTLLLIAMLGGTPNLVSAATMPQASAQEQQPPAGREEPGTQQPAEAPPSQETQSAQPENTAPAATQEQTGTLPDAPSATQSATQPTPQEAQTPAGTAAAQAGEAQGGPASKPAGAAIAPAKQHRSRSLLIKIGLIAGAGAALGTVFALSQASPSRPPGSR